VFCLVVGSKNYQVRISRFSFSNNHAVPASLLPVAILRTLGYSAALNDLKFRREGMIDTV